MIEQIRHLQSRAPLETFALELAHGRVIQNHERHLVATTSGTHHGEGVIGVLYENGSFELINAGQNLECQRRGSSEGQRRACSANGVGQKRIRGADQARQMKPTPLPAKTKVALGGSTFPASQSD